MDVVSITRELRHWEGLRGAGAGTGAGTKIQGGIQHHDGVVYGVFKFLNLTTRREMMNWGDRDRDRDRAKGREGKQERRNE